MFILNLMSGAPVKQVAKSVGSGMFWTIIVNKHSSSLRLQMQVKSVPCKTNYRHLEKSGWLLSPQAYLRRTDKFTFQWIMGVASFRLKRERANEIVASRTFKSQHLWWNAVMLTHTVNSNRYIEVVEQHMLPDDILFSGKGSKIKYDTTAAWLYRKCALLWSVKYNGDCRFFILF